MNGGLYIHIPFCRSKCDYCGFYSEPSDSLSDSIEKYIPVLIEEIKEQSDDVKNISFDSVFFGGGTPSLLSPAQISDILSVIKEHYSLLNDPEITVEINPSDVSSEKLDGYRQTGVNRLTLGVQTLDKEAYAYIGRCGGFCTPDILDTYFSIKGVSPCIDIIAGIPHENINGFLSNLKALVAYGTDHFSVYILSLENESPFAVKKKLFTEKEESDQAEMYLRTINFLTENGYEHYEISNFAKPGKESRHNLKYWKWESWLGFGPSAHSFINGMRFYNESSIREYLNGDTKVYDVRRKPQEMAEFIMTGLRLRKGFSEKHFTEVFNDSIPDSVLKDMEKAVKNNEIEIQNAGMESMIRISDASILHTDTVIFNCIRSLL
jgi:oxygen-independent coproporphyrinogen III oxidase